MVMSRGRCATTESGSLIFTENPRRCKWGRSFWARGTWLVLQPEKYNSALFAEPVGLVILVTVTIRKRANCTFSVVWAAKDHPRNDRTVPLTFEATPDGLPDSASTSWKRARSSRRCCPVAV